MSQITVITNNSKLPDDVVKEVARVSGAPVNAFALYLLQVLRVVNDAEKVVPHIVKQQKVEGEVAWHAEEFNVLIALHRLPQ
jgi:hypothetical protein